MTIDVKLLIEGSPVSLALLADGLAAVGGTPGFGLYASGGWNSRRAGIGGG
jgi:hypothetical protein